MLRRSRRETISEINVGADELVEPSYGRLAVGDLRLAGPSAANTRHFAGGTKRYPAIAPIPDR